MGEPRENGCKECRLIRTDGSEWIVTGFDLDTVPPHVEALRPDWADSDRSVASASDGASDDGAGGSGVEHATLERGDRLEWRDQEGRVIWTFRSPVGSQEA